MTKSKVLTIAQSGTNQWKDKQLTKWFITFENNQNGTLTTGFDETPAPLVGAELEFDLVDNGYGMEIKLPRKSGGGGGGFSKAWTPQQVAQQDAIKLTQSYIASGADLKFWKQFFIEAKSFMVENNETPKAAAPIQATNPNNNLDSNPVDVLDDLPF